LSSELLRIALEASDHYPNDNAHQYADSASYYWRDHSITFHPTGSIVAPESFPESSLFTVKIFAGGENTSFAFTISIFIGSGGSAPPCRHVPGLI